MSTYEYITDTNHAETLAAALDAFCEALTRRWRDEVCRAIVIGDPSVPRWIRREAAIAQPNSMISAIQRILPDVGRGEELRWDCWSAEARAHLEFGGACTYLWWVNHGQEGDLSAVTCLGHTDGGQDGYGRSVPERIECGMGIILEQVADWAYAEREHVFSQLPLFDRHDMVVLDAACDSFVSLGRELTQGAADGSGGQGTGSFDGAGAREIKFVAESIARPNVGDGWLAEWTGLAAEAFTSGFAASVVPTVINQSRIVEVLASLYAARATIVEKGRRDALYWISSATVSLDETETVHVDRTNFWVAVEGIGMATGLVFAATGAGVVVGAGIALAGFVGQYLDPGSTTEVYADNMVEIVGRLNDEIGKLNREIATLEIGYLSDVGNLRESIHGVHSFNLELYDLTQNDAEGDHGEPGRDDTIFTAEIEFVLGLSEDCYTAGELYAQLLPIIAETRQADRHLADLDGRPTPADLQLIEVRDQLEEYLKTTCGRYLLAGDQVRGAAEAYVRVDTSQRDQFHSLMAGWDEHEIGEFRPDFDPEDYAEATDRPWTWAPERDYPGPGGISPPGAGAGDDYATDADEYGGAGR
jgi:hypothetical protein